MCWIHCSFAPLDFLFVGGLQNQMARDGVGQLRRISSQQSKIRMLRNVLAAHVEAVSQLEAAFAELVLITRVPPAYRQCLAECMRRWRLLAWLCCRAWFLGHISC